MRIILYILCLLFALSCKEKQVTMPPRENIKIDSDNSICSINDFMSIVDTIKVLPLDTIGGYMVGSVSKLITDENYYYILDIPSKSIYKFDSCGIGVLNINRVGKSIGEYVSPTDISISDSMISIYDKGSSKIINYDKRTGNFVKEYKLDFPISNFINTGKYDISLNTTGNSSLTDANRVSISDKEGNAIKSFIPQPLYLDDKSIIMYKPMCFHKDNTLFIDFLDQNIYEVSIDSCIIKYFLDFGKYNIPPAYLHDNASMQFGGLIMDLNKNTKYINCIDFLIETDNYIYCNYLHKGVVSVLYYNKTNKKAYILNKESIGEHHSYWAMIPALSGNSKNTFISVLNNKIDDDIYNKIKSDNIPKLDCVLEKIRGNDKLQNPILLFTSTVNSTY